VAGTVLFVSDLVERVSKLDIQMEVSERKGRKFETDFDQRSQCCGGLHQNTGQKCQQLARHEENNMLRTFSNFGG
jgi:hypothetical protein